MKKIITLLLMISYAFAGFSQDTPSDIDILLNSDGDVALTQVPAKSKVTSNKGQSLKNDTLVKQFEDKKQVKIFTKKGQPGKKAKHDKISIDIPDRSIVSLQAQTGDVSLSNLDASLHGSMQQGTLSISNMRGDVEMISGQGDIFGKGIESTGLLIARDGNIELIDVTGAVEAYAPKGRVKISIGPVYYQKSPKPLEIGLQEGDIDLALVPYGGKVRLGKGTLTASEISGPLAIRAEAASITLKGVTAPVSVRNNGPVYIQLQRFKDSNDKGGMVELQVENGDLTIELGKGFTGALQVRTTEINPLDALSKVESTLELGKPQVFTHTNADNTMSIRETTYSAGIGKGSMPVVIHVTNGRLIIKN